MAKRPDTGKEVILALELLRRIPRNRKVSAQELRKQLKSMGLERTDRTIQRQLKELIGHFDIECDDREKPYGYSWKEKSKGFSIPTLSEQESVLLLLAEKNLGKLLPPGIMRSMRGFFEQARYNLLATNQKSGHAREWLSKVRVVGTTQPLLPATIKDDVFAEVSAALYGNRWLRIDYKNASGYRAEYDVMPLGLAQQGPSLYLVCRFKGHDNERSLALHRMQKAHASVQTFQRPKEFNLEKYDNDGRFGFGEGKRVSLSFIISRESGAHLLETPLSTDQTVKEKGDEYHVTATVVDSGHLEWWLRGFGDQVRNIRRKNKKK